jgi:NAD(P)-dependent dehydrogenase (short-subunit alcohol dehydrogenase family)
VLGGAAGILSNNKVVQTSVAEWDRVMRVNVTGAFNLIQQLVPGMKQQKYGRIVNVCSMAAKTGGVTAGTGEAAGVPVTSMCQPQRLPPSTLGCSSLPPPTPSLLLLPQPTRAARAP